MKEPIFPRRQPCPCGSGKRFKDCCEEMAPTIDPNVLREVEAREPGTISAMISGLDAELAQRTA